MTQRVFFVTSNQIEVFDWQKKTLISFYEFRNDDEGIKNFEHYLECTEPAPTKILVELLEEDFQREKIPYVLGGDRKALIDRQLIRHYRDSKYTHSQTIGRESEGRRDLKLLLTCISNPEPLDVWMALLIKHNTPISGIWSLPLISEELLKKLKPEGESALLVSRQMRSTLRESYFLHDKLMLSRQVKIIREVAKERSARAYVSDGIDQIHKYLSNQRIIKFGAKLDVLCVLPEDLIEEAESTYTDTDVLHYQFFSLDKLFSDYGIESKHKREADVLFAYLCTLRPLGSDQYHPSDDKVTLYAYFLDRLTFHTYTFGSLVLFIFAAFLFLSSIDVTNKKNETDASRNRLERIYAENYSGLEHKIDAADLIVETIAFSKRLKNEASFSPEKLLPMLSDIYSDTRFAIVSLDSLVWEKLHGNPLDALRQDIWAKTTPKSMEYQEYEYNEAELNDKIPVLRLKGRLETSTLSYRETVVLMEAFVARLQRLPNIDQLMVVRTPVDIRVTSRFSDDSGADATMRVISDDANIYEILLLMSPSEPEPNMEDEYDGS